LSGLFLTFEGADGAGKTTQISLIADALHAAGHAVTRTREPGGDSVGERVRELLLQEDVGVEAELLLFAAARARNVQTVVRPALTAGRIVLCDRYTDSTIAYQGYGRGLPLDLIARINDFASGGLRPDRTFLLDLPPAEGLARQSRADQNRLDRESLAFHQRVRDGFLAIARAEPERVLLLDASRPAPEIAADLRAAIFALLR
jgi:dTMP kinase